MKYVVYGKEACQSCKDAVALLDGEDFEYKSFGKDYDLSKFAELSKAHRSFPLISVVEEGKEVYLGGLEKLKVHLNK